MATITNPYDALYTNLKNRFTVELDGRNCTVADFMIAKAGKRSATGTALTVAHKESSAIVNVISYVNDKLTMKVAPRKDEIMTRFPIRTSASAIMRAVAACAMVIGCGVFALSSRLTTPYTADGESGYEQSYDGDADAESDEEIIDVE